MITLKNKFGDFIYLDVVTKYSQSYTSQVSKHPVDGSGTVSDHVIRQNPKIQITGSITGADFNFSKPELQSEVRSFIGIDRIVVDSEIASVIEVQYEENPYRLLPDVAGQFFSDSLPTIENLSEARNSLFAEKVLFSVLESFWKKREVLTLYEFDEGLVVDEEERLLITNLSVNESAESGDALMVNITLEQITFANLLEEEIPEDVIASFQKQAEEKEKKGGQSGEEVETETSSDTRGAAKAFKDRIVLSIVG